MKGCAAAGNPYHDANRRRWNVGAAAWAERADRRDVWRRCVREPGLVLHERERHGLGELAGRRVCVLGSGDNEAVFALAGLGAQVTSVDLSEGQLAVARGRAAELGLAVVFVRADVTDLSALADASFDVVYTGGHVAVWVSDLRRYYAEAARILKPGGRLVVSEYHPFRRGWKDAADRLERAVGYFERGPHIYDDPSLGRTYEFHWTVMDFVEAVLASGLELISVEEFGDEAEDWETTPLKGLPRVLLLVARRRCACGA